MHKPTSVVGYCRVSTSEQADEGVSLEAQEAKVRAYCTMRGLTLTAIFTDPGVSASIPLADRPAGARMLALVNRGQVAGVVACKLDRLFRDCSDCLSETAAWDRHNVALHLLDLGGQAVSTSTPMGRFFLTVMAGAAELELNLIRERTRQALAHKKSKGECCGNAPYGWRAVPAPATDPRHAGRATPFLLVEPDPDEQATLTYIHDLAAAGVGPTEIMQRLNREGRPARGDRWYKTTLSRILRKQAA